MKKIALLLPTFCLAAASMSANADTLKMVSSNGPTGPYSMQYNGTPVSLFCIDDMREITDGESWAVNKVSGADYFTTNTHSTDFKYEEETYILSQETNSNNQDVQDALWAIFDSSDHLTNGSTAANLVTNASTFNYTTAFLSGYDFYIPVNPGGRNDPEDWDGNGIPQEFIGQNGDPSPVPTPEPSTLALFGSGLVGMAGILRRKLARG
jgi:PEP-CTERM motif